MGKIKELSGDNKNESNLDKTKKMLWEFLSLYTKLDWDEKLKIFKFFENHGYHITQCGFYSPIPTISELSDEFFDFKDYHIDWNEINQLNLLKNLKTYSAEFKDLTKNGKYALVNGTFEHHDAPLYYSLIRHFKPERLIEVGSGNSTKLAYFASLQNPSTSITSIDPFMPKDIEKEFSKSIEIIKKPVQDIPLSLFEKLSENDILFIDSSHVSKVGSDVNFLFFEVLPILKPGVVVHIHDIFLPNTYPREWLEEYQLFWNEQFLLHAFLIGNKDYEVVFAVNYIDNKYPEKLREFCDLGEDHGGGSFWIRKK